LIERGASRETDGEERCFRFDGDIDQLHFELAVHGPFQRIRDECGRGSLVARFRLLLFHLTAGGELRLRLPPVGTGFDAARDKLLRLVDTLNALRAGPALSPPVIVRTDARPNAVRDLHALAGSLGDLRLDGDALTAICQVDTCAKVPELRMNDLLRERPDLGRLIESVPAAAYESRGRFSSSSPDELRPAEYAAPPLSLREYHGPVVAPRQVAIHDGVVLTESFRNPVRPRLRSRSLLDWSRHFVRRPELGSTGMLPGRWFYLDNIKRGHFGHALTEQLSHVWGWKRAKQEYPGLRALVFASDDQPMNDWEYRLLEAAGIGQDEVTVLDEPVRVETLVTSTPAYAIGPYVHPAIRETYAKVGRILGSQAPQRSRPRRLFVTRRSSKRACRNQDRVETLFVRAGFEIVNPLEHDLADQVAMVRAAQEVAGFAGSGMFHLSLADAPKNVAVISSETYPANNERQICAFAGHDLTMLRCRPDVVSEGFTSESFHSSFWFDDDREGRVLAEWLAQVQARD
jgi:capsular polysaccharide biosynthesis protein